MNKPLPTNRREKGAVLVTTLIVLTVLAVVAVAFMQSTSMDQLSSRSVSGAFQARLIAESAVGFARGDLSRLVARYPDSVTVWQNIGGAQTNEATVLYVRADAANTNTNARPGQFGGEVAYLGQPLVSGITNLIPVANLSNALPFVANSPDLVNLNATNSSREAFVGVRSTTNGGAPVAAAQWVYVGRSPGPTNATNPPIGRYAYWVEDESFKVNVNVASNGARGSASLGRTAAEARIDGSWGSSTNAAASNANFAAIVSDRATLGAAGFPSVATAALAGSVSSTSALSEIRFLSTTHSAGLDLSRGGFKRVNLNTAATNGGPGAVRTNLNRLIVAITNTNAAPLFAHRFYRLANNVPGINATNAVTANHQAIYLQKIAANIYDYLDADDQPTVISNNEPNFTIMTGKPNYGIEAQGGGLAGSNSIAAMGVENVPRLQEYAIHGRVRSMRYDSTNDDSFGFVTSGSNAPSPLPTQASFEVWIDHYFEFWNPGTKDIVLTNAFLKIYDQPSWNVTGSLANSNRETLEITVNNVRFPAGRVTVLTTAPVGAVSIGAGGPTSGNALIDTTNAGNVISLPTASVDRVFSGDTRQILSVNYNNQGLGPNFGYTRIFAVPMRARSTSTTDYESAVLLGNDNGILESFVGLPIGNLGGGAPTFQLAVTNGYIRDGMAHMAGAGLGPGNNDNLRGGSLLGNQNATTTPSPFEGDPRSLNEQLEFLNSTTGGSATYTNITRFFNTIGPTAGGSIDMANSSVGAPNANFVFPSRWSDPSSINAGESNAPLIVRNGPMESIGELGHVTDPARPYYTSGTIPVLARGGARTFRIGQPEVTGTTGTIVPWYTGNQTNASRTWTSWRLADIFTVATNMNTNFAIPGLINPNGTLRDNGAALRAAMFGLIFQNPPDGAPTTAGRPANITNLVTNVIARLTNGNAAGLTNSMNPFWERGELSELAVLNSATANALLPGGVMSNAFDRGREELVRRSIEMITTRGSVFTVYAIGQSLRVTANSTNITGTVRVKSTFEMTPQFQFPTDARDDAFDPGNAVRVTRRFLPPTNYTTKILSSSYD